MNDGIKNLVKIKVIGVGGGGGNAINDMLYSGVSGVEYVAANTDKQDLDKSLADIKLQIGEKLTRGLGAGADPLVGRQAAEEDVEKIQELLKGTDMLFITAGMGGGTGTGAAPVIAKIARELDILTVAVVTKPFSFEGKKRANNATSGIELLKENVDSLVIIPNDKLFDLPDKTITLQNAFKEANNILRIGIKAVVDLVMGQGFINLDFADIRTTLKNSGIAVLGFGDGEGENRAVKAAEKALLSPLLEKSIQGADKILINLMTSQDVELTESQIVTEIIREAAGKNVEDVMFGVSIVPEFTDRIEITIIANNFKDETEKSEPFINVDSTKKIEEVKPNVKVEESEDLDLPPWMRNKR
ncbi:MAG: cell division protein FtsZ [Fusobacterium sp.]|nr:cell division protein FtsZ [Fusobacterium sp.]